MILTHDKVKISVYFQTQNFIFNYNHDKLIKIMKYHEKYLIIEYYENMKIHVKL